MKLFENKERTDKKPANHLDNKFDFYDRSRSPQVTQIRETLNKWFDNYPDPEKKELKTRFLSSFSSAFYELFLHELFIKQGYTLEPHPKIPGTTKRPDFLVSGHGLEFYLEAKESTDKTDSEKSMENRINSLYDQINKTKSPNFFLKINELIIKSKGQPSGNKIISFLEKELLKFDPEILSKRISEKGFDQLDEITYDDNHIKLSISLIPKSPKIRGKDGIRPIGIYPFLSLWGGSDNSIKSAIEKKATRYGVLNKPYLICVNSTSERITDDFDVMNALFGSLQVTFSMDSNNRNERYTRAFDGVFFNSKGPKFTRVSAVLITNVHCANLHIAKLWLVEHPFAKLNINLEQFAMTKIVVENNHV